MDANWWFRKIILGIPLRFFFPVRITGIENLPKSGSFIIAAGSHTTEIESALMAAHLHWLRIRFFAKAEYWDNGLMGWFMTATGQVPVNRQARDIGTEVVGKGVKLIREGHRIALQFYPESTRSYDGKVHKGGVSPARIAIETDRPVVPVGLRNMDRIQPEGAKLWQIRPFRRGVSIHIGTPIHPSNVTGIRPSDNVVSRQATALAARTMTEKIMLAIADLCGKEYAPTRLEYPRN